MSNAIWHSRLGHPSISLLKSLISKYKLSLSGNAAYDFCSSCPLGKSHRLPFALSSSMVFVSLELIHSDVWTSPTYSINGFKYYVIFVDDYSRYTWIYPLKLKSNVFQTFVTFKNFVENMLGTKIKSFRSDGGGEYVNTSFK